MEIYIPQSMGKRTVWQTNCFDADNNFLIYLHFYFTLEFIRYETSWKHLMNFTERKYSFNAPNDQMELSVGEWM